MGWPGPLTHRQFAAWQAWLEMQWNQPDRGDFYAMQIAAAHGIKDPYIRFPDRRQQRQKQWPAREQRWASTTDDASGWWVPHPLTEAELAEMNKRLRRQHGN